MSAEDFGLLDRHLERSKRLGSPIESSFKTEDDPLRLRTGKLQQPGEMAPCSRAQVRAQYLQIGSPCEPVVARFHRYDRRCSHTFRVKFALRKNPRRMLWHGKQSEKTSIILRLVRAGLHMFSSHLKQFGCVGRG